MFVKMYSPTGAVVTSHPVNVEAKKARGYSETPPKSRAKSAQADTETDAKTEVKEQ